MSRSIKEIAQVAAKWWADKVIDPKMDNGDDSFTGFLGMHMAKMLVKPIDENVKTNFTNNLANVVETKLTNTQHDVILDVDYGPCIMLREVAKISGVPDTNFPIKTVMWIDKEHVSVRYGYSADREYLYASKAYWQNEIDSFKRSIERYKNGSMLSWVEDEEERKQKAAESITYYESLIKKFEIELEKAEE